MKKCIVSIIIIFLITLHLFSVQCESNKDSNKCAVCGMMRSKVPRWNASIVFKNLEKISFCTPQCLFNFYFNISRYTDQKKEDIIFIYVKDYYSGNDIDAKKSYFVQGSDIIGPMGPELVPIEDNRKAKTFYQDHKGQHIYSFDNITPTIVLNKSQMQ